MKYYFCPTPAVLLHFWCPDSPKRRQHRCPFPALHPLHCIPLPAAPDLHGRCSSVPAPSAVMNQLPTPALCDSSCLKASGVDLTSLKSTFIGHRHCSWENKGCDYPWKYRTFRTETTGPLTWSPEQLHISHSVRADTGPDVVFDVLPSTAGFKGNHRS